MISFLSVSRIIFQVRRLRIIIISSVGLVVVSLVSVSVVIITWVFWVTLIVAVWETGFLLVTRVG